MGSTWGKNIKLSIFGESHGNSIGVTIDGLPPGMMIDFKEVDRQMDRRRPGKNKLSTARKETDKPEILSGIFNNRTTGTPICAVIKNGDRKSSDYSLIRDNFRPGHADYTGYVRYRGFSDYRGGGHFSGRLTAPIVFTGAICRQLLKNYGIEITSHIKSIKNIEDKSFDYTNIESEVIKNISHSDFPLIDSDKEEEMKYEINKAREKGDSVGGKIECAIIGIHAGSGDPIFDTVESVISHIMFSIPAVKGIEFGDGFKMSEMYGSESNDCMYIDEDKNIKGYTNSNGGINGGITNGMPVVFTVAIKPTPSISKPQKTVNISSTENTEIIINGRHDPCIVPRAVSVIESAAAIAVLDIILEAEKVKGVMKHV